MQRLFFQTPSKAQTVQVMKNSHLDCQRVKDILCNGIHARHETKALAVQVKPECVLLRQGDCILYSSNKGMTVNCSLTLDEN